MIEIRFSYNPMKVKKCKQYVEGRRWNPDGKYWYTSVDSPRNLIWKMVLEGASHSPMLFYPTYPSMGEFFDKNLWDHQKSGVNFVMEHGNSILAMDTRTGKTRTAIEIHNQLESNVTWFVTTKQAKMDLSRKVTNDHLRQGTIFLITYEQFTSVVDSGDYPEDKLPDFVIYDEIHRLKNDSGRGRKAVNFWLKLADKDLPKIIGLTATPAPKDPSDWYNLMEITRPGFLPYRTKQNFIQSHTYGKFIDTATGLPAGASVTGNRVWKVDDWNYDKLKETFERFIDPYVYRAKKYEVFPHLRVPKNIRIKGDPDKKTLSTAKKLRKLHINNPSRLVAGLKQLSDGFLYRNEYDEEYDKYSRSTKLLPNSVKMQLLDRVINDKDFRKRKWSWAGPCSDRVVVFCAYTGSIDSVYKQMKEWGYKCVRVDGRGWKGDTEEILREFDENTRSAGMRLTDKGYDDGSVGGEKFAIIGHPQSLSTGLELSAAQDFIYYSHCDNGEAEMQSVERAQSGARRGRLKIWHLMNLESDRIIVDRLKHKGNLQSITLGDIDKSFEKDGIREDSEDNEEADNVSD